MILPNETKIRFCNAMAALTAHCQSCAECEIYWKTGDGDLCTPGKKIVAGYMLFADTNPEPKEE